MERTVTVVNHLTNFMFSYRVLSNPIRSPKLLHDSLLNSAIPCLTAKDNLKEGTQLQYINNAAHQDGNSQAINPCQEQKFRVYENNFCDMKAKEDAPCKLSSTIHNHMCVPLQRTLSCFVAKLHKPVSYHNYLQINLLLQLTNDCEGIKEKKKIIYSD